MIVRNRATTAKIGENNVEFFENCTAEEYAKLKSDKRELKPQEIICDVKLSSVNEKMLEKVFAHATPECDKDMIAYAYLTSKIIKSIMEKSGCKKIKSKLRAELDYDNIFTGVYTIERGNYSGAKLYIEDGRYDSLDAFLEKYKINLNLYLLNINNETLINTIVDNLLEYPYFKVQVISNGEIKKRIVDTAVIRKNYIPTNPSEVFKYFNI